MYKLYSSTFTHRVFMAQRSVYLFLNNDILFVKKDRFYSYKNAYHNNQYFLQNNLGIVFHPSFMRGRKVNPNTIIVILYSYVLIYLC